MIIKKDTEKKNGVMVPYIRDFISKEKKMELGNINGLMIVNILEIGKIMNIMDLELIYMLIIKKYMKVILKIIIFMEMVII